MIFPLSLEEPAPLWWSESEICQQLSRPFSQLWDDRESVIDLQLSVEKLILLGGIILWALLPGALAQNDVYVVTSLQDSGPGTLRDAVRNVARGGTISFDDSIGGGVIEIDGSLKTNKHLIIDGSPPRGGIRIDFDERLIIQSGSDVTLRGLTMTGNGEEGALVISNHGKLVVRECLIMNRRGSWSEECPEGSIFNSGDLTVSHSQITGNWLESGYGGGVFQAGGTALLEFSSIDNNYGEGGGGAIYQTGGSLTIRHCLLHHIGEESVVHSDGRRGGTLTIENSLVTGRPWAIRRLNGDLTVRNSTITSAIHVSRTLTIENTIAANIDIEANNIVGRGNNLFSGNPMLAPLGYYGGPTYSMPPLPGSPAIDAGAVTEHTSNQGQREGARVLGEGLDIGAVELSIAEAQHGAAMQTVVISNADAGVLNNTNTLFGTLRYVLSRAPAGSTVTFDPALPGKVIRLSSINDRPININRDVTIDACSLPGGITIDTGGPARALVVRPGVQATVRGITFENGRDGVGGISDSATIQGCESEAGYVAWAQANISTDGDRSFLGDADRDGISNALEYATGMKFVPQVMREEDAQIALPFDYSNEAMSDTTLRITRSTDLQSFEEILRIEGGEVTLMPHITLGGAAPSYRLIDENTQPKTAFYQIEVEKR